MPASNKMIRLLLICSIFLISCSTFKRIKANDNLVALKNLSVLNGDYTILSNDSSKITLDFALLFKEYSHSDIKTKYKISLKAIDYRHLEASILKNDSLIKTKILKGKIDNGYFVFKTKKASPFYFILNVFGNKTTRIGQLKSGDLLVDSRHFVVATLIIIPLTGGRDEQYNLIFRRKATSR